VITKEEYDAQVLLALKTAYTPDPFAKAAAASKASVTAESVMAASRKLTNALSEIPEFKDFGPALI
jgi:hypothetical protein